MLFLFNKGAEIMKRGNARVSTSGQDLRSQIDILKEEKCDVIYAEKFTGTKKNRPEFNRLLHDIEPGDTLVVTKMDRFARSTKDALETIEELFEKGIRTHVLNMGIIEDKPTSRLIFTIMSVFADFERDLIVERTQEGKKIAKLKPGFKEGRPREYTDFQLDQALELKKTNSYKQVTEMTGISKSTLYRYEKSKDSED